MMMKKTNILKEQELMFFHIVYFSTNKFGDAMKFKFIIDVYFKKISLFRIISSFFSFKYHTYIYFRIFL